MKNPWKTLESKYVYQNPWMKVREDKVIRPDGSKGIYGVIESKDSVYIVALTDKMETYLVGQFRYPTKVFSLEVPGGGIGDKSLLAAAMEELKEEAGLLAKKWTSLGRFQIWGGLAEEWGHIFIAEGLSDLREHKQEDEGISKMVKVPFKEALRMIEKDQITASETIVSLTRAAMKLKLLK